MREIKFRCWDANNEVMAEIDELDGDFDFIKDGDRVRSTARWQDVFNGDYCDLVPMQFIGLVDKNGKEIYEGDVLRWFTIDIEYQTHLGDNIPGGSYTEPCGSLCKKFQMPVVFRDAMFTCSLPRDQEEEEPVSIDCPIQWPIPYDRKELNNIFWPRPYHKQSEVLSDEDFLEVARSCAEELGFECVTIEEFIQKLNGFEVIGNIYENPELLNP